MHTDTYTESSIIITKKEDYSFDCSTLYSQPDPNNSEGLKNLCHSDLKIIPSPLVFGFRDIKYQSLLVRDDLKNSTSARIVNIVSS